ncbi:molybdopterin oxidoreductase family protein [Paramicrobacterium fandaimingii]|uniref:molybdopterin oxidoreductase family protein n=1 Tax=Paramicrobacterium fandaimingii TaxID=2708079 RepID=UPI0014221F13|nr:molybdopterin oxidoreductase family protein [Microbacterium fandaimingii]
MAGSHTDTHCPYCGLQCALRLESDGTELAVTPRDFPTNRGGLCRKGWTSAELLTSPHRLTEPLVRQADGALGAASWEEALDTVGRQFRTIRAEQGADRIGVFGSGGLTNEKVYQLGKFARAAVGTSRIDYNGRFCMAAAAAATTRAFGLDRGLPFPLEDLDNADSIMLLGSNVATTMPPFLKHLRRAQASGGLIVCDPRRSATAQLTDEGNGIHLQSAPHTDIALLLGLTHIVFAEKLADVEYLESRTTGAAALRRSVAAWWPERVQHLTGVPASQLRDTARRLAGGRSYILTGRGVEQHTDGTDTVTAAINLALALGLPGRTGSGYGTITGQGNGQGGREHGQKCDQLPGCRSIDDPAARRHIAGEWGIEPDKLPGKGVPAAEILRHLGRAEGVSALMVNGSNPAISGPNASAIRDGLKRLDFLIVCDFFLSETAAFADVVLPVSQWAEEEGTMTSLEGRIIRRRRARPAPSGVRSELWVLRELAARINPAVHFDDDPERVFAELSRASVGAPADYSGLDYSVLEHEEPAYWPYPAGSTGTPRLFLDSFSHADGRAHIRTVVASPPPPSSGPLLITGRLLEHYQSGAQTRRVTELLASAPEAQAEIHPELAEKHGVAEGDQIVITNEHGRMRATAHVTPNVRIDTIFVPFHFPSDQSVNLVTSDATDPLSGMPEFKSAHVSISRLSGTQ